MSRARILLPVLALLVVAACGTNDVPSGVITDRLSAELELVVDGLDDPVFVTAAPGDFEDRLFVVEQGGLVRIVENGALLPEPFLDLTAEVTSGGERGLLGLAFHPNYGFNGWFFVNYTDLNGDTRIVRYAVSSDPNVADESSAFEILAVDQPQSNHNGGMLAFGPFDGYLYVGLGDGGGSGDPDNYAQRPATLLGSMLRIDVDDPDDPYFIPFDNPFLNTQDFRPEIWAFGLRSPWRYSFDRQTGDLYIADVGQNAWEEVSVQPAASDGSENYGWRRMEGTNCFNPSTGCNQGDLVLPVYEYPHSEGCSITGGYVYRGDAIPELRGRYLFADYCEGWVRSFLLSGGAATDVVDHSDELAPGGNVVSFGEDNEGELYVVDHGGAVYRIVPRS
ncbi:MAG: PQQ-dependent sugar dehydrogenase [Gemmatimonadota bacterium]